MIRAGVAVAAIAGNEMRRVARDRIVLVLTLALPVVIIVVIGSTFGSMGEAVPVGLVAHDDSPAATALTDALDASDGLDVEAYDSLDELRRDVRVASVTAGVIVPEGYGAAVDTGDAVEVGLIVSPSSNGAAAVRPAVEAAVADEAARLAAARVAVDNGAVGRAEALATAERLAPDLPRTVVHREQVGDDQAEGVGQFSYVAPSNLVLFTFINTVMVGALIASDRKQGLVRRMLATPHGAGTIAAGLGAAKLAFALVQSMLIVLVGTLLFGVDWGDPWGAAALVVLFALVSTAAGVLVGAVVADAEQAQSIAAPVAIAMGMLGGCMWPLEVVPPVMRTIGHAVPHAWAMDAWQALVLDGADIGAVGADLAALTGFAAVLSLLAAWRLRVALTR